MLIKKYEWDIIKNESGSPPIIPSSTPFLYFKLTLNIVINYLIIIFLKQKLYFDSENKKINIKITLYIN